MKKDSKKRIGWLLPTDYRLIEDFYISETALILENLKTKKQIDDLLRLSQKAFNMQRFIEDTIVFDYPEVAPKLESALKSKFGDNKILQNVSELILTELFGKSAPGEYGIGENKYVVLEGKFYYRSLNGRWYIIPKNEVFLLLPTLANEVDQVLVSQLDKLRSENDLDLMMRRWQTESETENDIKNVIHISEGETTPKKYFDSSVAQIEGILDRRISLKSVMEFIDNDKSYLEKLCKVSLKLIWLVKKIRSTDTLNLYLLRDGMMMAEVQKALDLITGVETDSGQIMINRKLLSKDYGDEFYWNLSSDALYWALQTKPTNFSDFYKHYFSHMREQERVVPEFSELLTRLAKYIEPTVLPALEKGEKIRVVDTGFQGSITLLTKYIIDTRILHKNKNESPVDVLLFVTGEWFKEVYEDRYASDYYPFMRDIEFFNRSEYLYRYQDGSFEEGEVKVLLGNEEYQRLSNIELVVLTMLCDILESKQLNQSKTG